MRKSGLTRSSPNLVILCLRKGVSLRKIKFLQKDTFGKALGYRCGTGGAGREHDTCPKAKASRCIAFGRGHAEGHVVTNVDSAHVSVSHSCHFPPKTIVWSANGNNPEQNGLQMDSLGSMRLQQANKYELLILQVIFDQSGSIYLRAGNGTIIMMVMSNTISMQDFYKKATLEYDGVFRYYVYPKSTRSTVGRWSMAWSTLSYVPSNICTSLVEYTGGGACGFNSLCRHDDEGTSCQCPYGYSYTNPNDVLKGCKQDFENECWKKIFPLSNGVIDPSVGGKALIKMRKDNSTLTPGGTDSEKKNTSTLMLIGALLSSLDSFMEDVKMNLISKQEWLPFSTIAQTDGKNISLGSSLTALDNKSFWASPSGEFAFDFQEIGKYGFLLAIWFNKVPERTIVWSANGDNLVQKGSTVELTSAGQFRLNDITTGKQIWVASSYGTGVVYAAMLDTGNFVLANRNSIHLWASFDQPTDTILPTQTLSQNSRLFARYTASNYSRGRFQLTLESDGNLRLYTTLFPLDSINSPYWSTNIKDSGVELMFNQSGSFYLAASNGSILTMVSDEIVSMQDFYQRATLDYDGVFRHYACPKSTGSSVRSWNMAWSTLSSKPKDICMSIFQDKGVGACGFNSICTQDQGPICQCPYGYTDMDPADRCKIRIGL
ncbi:PREDICTED: G-type lectin S-receptor [Prunus dulcis]|uniref:PREDICTED: G-type lectin S-receptor n=1 Tax=Prunus dulcis TaxID=3755 RepID=A0A5E4G0G1_PRUDU|nr:PREDICTED: G-type lectin S-receptor [Prunus dulcis]